MSERPESERLEIEEESLLRLLMERKHLREQVKALQERGTQLLDMYRRTIRGESPIGGLLSGRAIRQAVKSKDIEIEPFDELQLNPVSYDLRLGEEVRFYESKDELLDTKTEVPTVVTKIGAEGFVLDPGTGYLMHTEERIATKKFVVVIDGKSSVGRLFVQVHSTAGFGDPGFDGQYTLEVTCTHPVRVYAGMRIAQVRFHTIDGEVDLYNGHYVGETSRGAVPSMSWKQFT